VLRTLRNPLLRNGHLLTVSTVLTGLVGLVYWGVTAWRYEPASVGRNSAAISMMTLLAAIAQLDLATAMVRFLPSSVRNTGRLVACTYVVSGALAVLVSVCFVAVVPHISPGATYFSDPLIAGSFVVATLAYTLFVLQDSVLTGLRRTAWVPVENAVFGVAKVVLVVLFATAFPNYGIFASWLLPLVATVMIISVFLFGWAIPRHQREIHAPWPLPPVGQIVRFVAAGYIGAVCSIASMTLLPILVLSALGPIPTAGFSIAWVIAYSLHLVNINMGASLVVETAANRTELSRGCRQVLVHTSQLLAPVVVILMLFAPYLLGVLGPSYRSAGDALRLLVAASLPHLVVVTAINSARVQRRMGLVVLVQATQCVLAVGLGWALLQVMGVTGMGLAWLLTQSLVAGVVLLRRDLWLGINETSGRRRVGRQILVVPPGAMLIVFAAWVVNALRRRFGRPVMWLRKRRVGEELRALLPGLLPAVPTVAFGPEPNTWNSVQPVRTVTDVRVAFLAPHRGAPAAVLKFARTSSASLELRAQRDALAVLLADPRLVDWRTLLPRVLAFRDDGYESLSIETFLTRTDLATVLTRHPDEQERVVANALRSITGLHRQTGHVGLVSNDQLRRWVDEPLGHLREMCRVSNPALLTAVARLGESLRDSLTDRRVLVSWTHGDFTPGNVLLTDNGDRVAGIVDWGGARPDQLSILDSYLMLLASLRCREGRELGAIVLRLLRAGSLPDRERRLLDQVCVRLPGEPSPDVLDERVLILLTWLHHVATLRRKCDVYRRNRIWWTLNVEPVLRAMP
jgi:O-antigen/teichoic acid export membrane protein